MKIIVCLDEKNGMMFHKRRVSQDSQVCEDILRNTEGQSLYMSEYSYQMFKNKSDNIVVNNSIPLDVSGYQFVEDDSLMQYESQIEEMVVYYWNRMYPSDIKFMINLLSPNWKEVLKEDFVGTSHEKITKKIFVKSEA